MALSEDGRVFTWGDNQKFSCGREPERKESTGIPGEILLPAENSVLQLAAGGLTAGVLVGLRNGTTSFDNQSSTIKSMPRIRYVTSGEDKNLKFLIGSWNINAQNELDLKTWLLEGNVDPDIICVGFQELIELSSHSVAQDEAKSQIAKTHLGGGDKVCKYWTNLLLDTLNYGKTTEKYKLIKDARLAGVYLAVFIKIDLRIPIINIRSNITKVGVLGKLVSKLFYF